MRPLTRPHNIVYVILLAAFIRLFALNSSPPSPYWEEVALGYDAYSILKTGKDFHNRSFPLVAFESFGDWKPALYYYLIIPFIPVFGLTVTAVRLPSALMGIASVYLVYLLAKELKFTSLTATLSAVTLAIMPWHIQFSRAGFEVNTATFLLILGTLCLLRARQYHRYLLAGALCLIASMYTYHGLRVIAPFWGLTIIVVYLRSSFRSRWLWLSALVSIILLWPQLQAFSTNVIQQRFNETSLFSVSQAVLKTNLWRAEDGNSLLARLWHHRYWYWAKEITVGAIRHLDPAFLFINGDGNPRHQTGYRALLNYWMAIPLLIGLLSAGTKRHPHIWILLGWLLLATLPPALTKTTPHTLRFLPAAPAIAILIAVGIDRLWQLILKWPWRQAVVWWVMLIIVSDTGAYFYDYFQAYPKRSSQAWQYGYRQVMDYLKPIKDNYDHIYITNAYGRASMYAMFYWQISPAIIQQTESLALKDQGELLEIGQVVFSTTDILPNSLIVSDQPRVDGHLKQQFNFLDGKPAFYVYQN